MTDQSVEIINTLSSLIHPEILNDMNTHLKNIQGDLSRQDIFSNQLYCKFIGFNEMIGSIRTPTTRYLLYDGGLGMGNYIHIYYTIDKGYSIEFSNYEGGHSVNCISDDWNLIKQKVHEYFEIRNK